MYMYIVPCRFVYLSLWLACLIFVHNLAQIPDISARPTTCFLLQVPPNGLVLFTGTIMTDDGKVRVLQKNCGCAYVLGTAAHLSTMPLSTCAYKFQHAQPATLCLRRLLHPLG